MSKSQKPSRFAVSRTVLFAIIAATLLTITAIGAAAPRFTFIDSVKEFFGVQPTQVSILPTQTEVPIAAPTPELLAPLGTTYTWNQTGSASWATSTNWTPSRTTPAIDDILVFNNGATTTVTNVPTQTIGQLSVLGNTTVALQPAAGVLTLTIGGDAGTDLSVDTGSALNISGGTTTTNTLRIFVGGGATGSISGTMTYTGANHTLLANDASGITFNNASTFTQGALCAGSVFTTTGTQNVIVFASGSTFVSAAGSNPFGLGQPSSKVVFQTGSLFSHQQSGTPGFSGRTYANFELNIPATAITVTGGNAVSIDNLTITAGTLNFNMTATPGHAIKGHIAVAGTLNFAPTSAGTVNLNGASAQTISGAGTLTVGANSTLAVSNSTGVTLQRNIDIGSGNFIVNSGGLLNCGNNIISGTPGQFTLSSGGNLGIGSAAGITFTTSSGNIQTANQIFSSGANYIYNGGTNQATGNALPNTTPTANTVNSLTVANTGSAGNNTVTLGSNVTGPVTVNSGTLGGTATITGTVTVNNGGTVAPGLSPGILNTGNVTFNSGSTFAVEIGGTTPGNTATDHDQLNVTGTVNLGAGVSTLSLATFGGFTPVAGNAFTIINNGSSDAVTGNFAGLSEGGPIMNFLGSGLNASISYVGGSGNDVVITVAAPANQPPVINDPGTLNVNTNATLQVPIFADDADNNESLTFSIAASQTCIGTEYTGTIFFTGPVTQITTTPTRSRQDLRIVTTPSTTPGNYVKRLQVTDGTTPAFFCAQITVTFANTSPLWNTTSGTVAEPGGVEANPVQRSVSLSVDDVDINQNLTFSLAGGTGNCGASPTHPFTGFSFVPNPVATTSGNETTSMMFNVGANDAASSPYCVRVNVNDRDAGDISLSNVTQDITVNVTAANSTPTVEDPGTLNVLTNEKKQFNIFGDDVDNNQTLSFSVLAGDVGCPDPAAGKFQSISFGAPVQDSSMPTRYHSPLTIVTLPGSQGMYTKRVQVSDGSLTAIRCLNITITQPPTFAINDVSQVETNGGTTTFTFTVTKTGSNGSSSLVGFTTQDGTATDADNDYEINSGSLSFSNTDTVKTIDITVNGDTTYEANETFNVHLTDAGNVAFTDADGTGTITNDDVPSVQFSSATYMEDESQTAAITITRSSSIGTTTVNLALAAMPGSATPGAVCGGAVDYVFTSPQLVTFNDTVVSQTVNIPLCADGVGEGQQPANFVLLSPTNGTIGSPGAATLTINDTASAYLNPATINIFEGVSASPYPSTITVSGGPAINGGIRVTLYDVSHSFPDHIDVLLVGPNGGKYVLMGDAGGAIPIDTGMPVTLTFTDSAGFVLPDSDMLTTGTYKPTTWESPVSSFPAPAPGTPYVEPGSNLDRIVEKSMFGTFGLVSANGMWSLYVRDDNGMLSPLGSVTGSIAGGWGIEFTAPTAAGVTVSGRVQTPDGRGLRNATVWMTDSQGVKRSVITSSFGFYTFDDVPAGETYLIGVSSKRYRFATRVIQVFDTLSDVDFTGIE